MSRPKIADSKEVGLDLSITLAKYFLKTDYLHYGYWTDDLALDISNLAKAQENHSRFLMAHLPEKIKTILDVGCGTGKLASVLTEKGYQTDCVAPSRLLTDYARAMLGEGHVFTSRYEDFQTENRYDLILFSESFQYVVVPAVWDKTLNLLNQNGYLLIMDFFKTDAEGVSPLGGGHDLKGFYDTVARLPFQPIKDIDITKETAPNLDLIDDFLTKAGVPAWRSVLGFLASEMPVLFKVLNWQFRKKLDNIERKYCSGTRNAKNFARFKSYRLLLYQKMG